RDDRLTLRAEIGREHSVDRRRQGIGSPGFSTVRILPSDGSQVGIEPRRGSADLERERHFGACSDYRRFAGDYRVRVHLARCVATLVVEAGDGVRDDYLSGRIVAVVRDSQVVLIVVTCVRVRARVGWNGLPTRAQDETRSLRLANGEGRRVAGAAA